jgi:hypothetical protein
MRWVLAGAVRYLANAPGEHDSRDPLPIPNNGHVHQ